jgi:4-hydroxy-3-polyprenylbenzoate decarboxylase
MVSADFQWVCHWSDDAIARKTRYVVAITGASGTVYGVRLLEALHSYSDMEIHLIVSKWGEHTLAIETGLKPDDLASLVHKIHPVDDLAASVSSGSFITNGMAIVPCSMKTVAAIAHGLSLDLISRAADVTLKERRQLVLVPRETPLSTVHLENLLSLSRLGADIIPPMPAFYSRPKSVDDIINHTVGRVLDRLGLEHNMISRWGQGDKR